MGCRSDTRWSSERENRLQSRWLLHVSALLFQDSQPSYTDRGVEPLLWFEHGKKPSLNDGDAVLVWKGRYGPRTHFIV
ncbi:hypothetical protein B296_00021430 [Ensete ventricosum]|uniref:Uncharacterized protein n=1 Tax=Ensete ventricosum TaxID=4639 RepID=A0A427AWF5_ENSVE|nr:hypothetical protein B296_00021430 [Ensete ventricosum]